MNKVLVKRTMMIATLLAFSISAMAEDAEVSQEEIEHERGRIEAVMTNQAEAAKARTALHEKTQKLIELINENPEGNAKIGTDLSTIAEKSETATAFELKQYENYIDLLIKHVQSNR